MTNNHWKLISVVFAFMFMIFLSACGGNNNTDTNNETGNDGNDNNVNVVNESDNDESDYNEGDAQSGGNVAIPIVADPIFNPWHPNAFAESNVVNRVLFSGLTRPGKDNAPAPSLAHDWDVSEDGLIWTFHLRDDVDWHDGEPFTAMDVDYTFNDIVLDPDMAANGAGDFSQVNEVVVVDDYEVEFHLESAYAALPAFLSFNAEIVPEHILNDGTDPWENTDFNRDNPVGTGAFMIDENISGQEVRLKKNPDFFEQEPYLDGITYKILPDTNTQVAQALSNEIDFMSVDDLSTINRLEDSDDIELFAADITRYFWISTNLEDERFQDVEVRQAILHAIDREGIIQSVLEGYATPAHSAITPDQEQYFIDDVTTYDFDPERAKELLAEAGWEDTTGDGFVDKDGETFTIEFEIAQQGNLEQLSVLVQQYLIDIGLDIELDVMEWNSMIDKVVIERDYQMSLNWWRYPTDPDVYAQHHSDNAGTGNNIPGYQSEELDNLLEQGSEETDIDERIAVYEEAQQYMSDNLPYIYLWYPQEIVVHNVNLQGVPEINYGNGLNYVEEWYFSE